MATLSNETAVGEKLSSKMVMDKVFNSPQLVDRIRKAKILMVGAGGIGCEVIKTLLLSGFTEVDMIDLDTIDVSNLNRQFLFNKTHVGQSKSEVAAKVAMERFSHKDLESSKINVRSLVGSIQQQDFDVEWFCSYTLVINALDNIAARSHVNRMCLTAEVPLIESGTEGYLGQTFLIQKGISACYECEGPRKEGRSFASCTIRNTPSLPIHCIVWGKHLFAQLFGEHDADNDVSPDMSDPELNKNDGVTEQSGSESESAGAAEKTSKKSTREWAQDINYDPKELFEKFFNTDVAYLLKMEQLWENRKKPIPLPLANLLEDKIVEAGSSGSAQSLNHNSTNGTSLKDQKMWSLKDCFEVFSSSVTQLKVQASHDQFLVWDKDDDAALEFVTAVSNLRSYCFSIERKSLFDVKSMAGNIIPAISSTNSIIGGLMVLQAINLLRVLPVDREEQKKIDKEEFKRLITEVGRQIYLRKVSLTAKNLVAGYEFMKPNPNCLSCAVGRVPEIEIACSLSETSLTDLVEQVILKKLHFVCPDISVDGTPTILYNRDDADDETAAERAASNQKVLSAYPYVKDRTRLKVYDLQQSHTLIIILKDEKIDPNVNEGLFYKLVVIREGDNAETNTEENDETELKSVIISESSIVEVQEVDESVPPALERQDRSSVSSVTVIEEVEPSVSRSTNLVSEADSDSDVVILEDDSDEDDDDDDDDVTCLDPPDNGSGDYHDKVYSGLPPKKRKTTDEFADMSEVIDENVSAPVKKARL